MGQGRNVCPAKVAFLARTRSQTVPTGAWEKFLNSLSIRRSQYESARSTQQPAAPAKRRNPDRRAEPAGSRNLTVFRPNAQRSAEPVRGRNKRRAFQSKRAEIRERALEDAMRLPTGSYADQAKSWPRSGRHLLAHFDDDTLIVYQAFQPAIGRFAVANGYFGGPFSYTRMSWIKPNFLWMMYRSDWGRSEGQEVVLGLRLRRTFFDALLAQAVPSSFQPTTFEDEREWQTAVQRSDVRLQWDPDHLPTGEKCERRAIQLGLRGKTLDAYGKRELVEVIDMSDFVAEQRANADAWQSGRLLTPLESVYVPHDSHIRDRVGLSPS
jgi:Domain of unknown function (DUF4291)